MNTEDEMGRHPDRILICVTAVFLVICFTGSSSRAGGPARIIPPNVGGPPTTSWFKGRVVDDSGKPVSGIFPMTFRLHVGLNSRKAIWSEFHWVAVDNGVYRIHLGEKKPLPGRADLSKLVLSVEIQGVGEVVREPFDAAPGAERSGGPAQASHQPTKGGVKYADNAGYAVVAEHAKNADRLQNLTVEELTRKVLEETGGVRDAVRVGKARRYGTRIGGPGGNVEYNEVCPPGTVMVGIRGAAGIYLDSIQIVCAPLE